jgi:tellurite resistance protein TehA-like permease
LFIILYTTYYTKICIKSTKKCFWILPWTSILLLVMVMCVFIARTIFYFAEIRYKIYTPLYSTYTRHSIVTWQCFSPYLERDTITRNCIPLFGGRPFYISCQVGSVIKLYYYYYFFFFCYTTNYNISSQDYFEHVIEL